MENKFEIKVGLNQIKYTDKDSEHLKESNLNKYDLSVTLNHWPSAVGWDSIFITIGIAKVIEFLAEGFLTELGKDLYSWSKTKLNDITNDKLDFEDSRVNINFTNCNINISCHSKEDLQYVTENIEEVILQAVSHKSPVDKEINVQIENGKEIKA